MSDTVAAAQRIRAAFLALGLEHRREVVRGLVSVTVHPGRSRERIVIEPADALQMTG